MTGKYFVAEMRIIVQLTVTLVLLQAALLGTSEELQDSGDNSTRRSRRMIWSTPLTDSHAPFKSPKWFVYLAQGNSWSKFLMKYYRRYGWQFIGEPIVSPENARCGGSLITPKIVGTACHCFGHLSSLNFTFVRFLPWNGWESFLAAYHGYYTRQDMEANPLLGSWAWSKRFVVHQQCGVINVHQKHSLENGKLIYDFGLIMLTREMTFVKPGSTLVPMYLPDDIIRMYEYVHRKESICLAIGFGKYNYRSPGVGGPASPVLMHGWRNIQNYDFCHSHLAFNTYNEWFLEDIGYDPKYVQTTMCHIPFGKIRSSTLWGDSGGPITCDNVYVGLNSYGAHLDLLPGKHARTPRLVSFAAAIAFAVEWHSANHRADMLKYLEEYAQTPELVALSYTFRPWAPGKYGDTGTSLDSSPKMSTPTMAPILAVLSILTVL